MIISKSFGVGAINIENLMIRLSFYISSEELTTPTEEKRLGKLNCQPAGCHQMGTNYDKSRNLPHLLKRYPKDFTCGVGNGPTKLSLVSIIWVYGKQP